MKPAPRAPALVGLALLLATPSLGHVGSGGGFSATGRLEAEAYSVPDPECDPDFDREHTFPRPWAGASGGTVVFLPHSGCGLTFHGLAFSAEGAFARHRVFFGRPLGAVLLLVWVDGAPAAEGLVVSDMAPALQEGPFLAASQVEPGPHTVRVEYRVLAGFWYDNLDIDFLDAALAS